VLTEALDAQEWDWSVRQARREAQAAHHQSGSRLTHMTRLGRHRIPGQNNPNDNPALLARA